METPKLISNNKMLNRDIIMKTPPH